MSETIPARGIPGQSSTSILGNAVLRREDATLIRGRGEYVANQQFEDLLHAHFVRSTTAHGTILSVDADEARSMPGVVAVYTADDLGLEDRKPPMGFYAKEACRSLLARERVRFVGEPVAVVVAETAYQAADAAEAVWADVDPLPAVVSVDDAVAADTVLFDGRSDNVMWEIPSTGAIDFSGCEAVVTERLWNSRVAAVPIETRVVAAAYVDGKLTCWASSQGTHGFRDGVAESLDMEPADVRVLVKDIGGGFGAKGMVSEEEIVVAQLARLLGRPVRWVESRTENLSAYVHGRAQGQTVTLGGTRDGRVTHYRLEIVQDCGAYPKYGPFLPEFTRQLATGVYDIANVEFSAVSVATNTAPICAYRGAGRPEATAAIERAMDLFAVEIGMDPTEVRRANFVAPEAFPYTTPTGTSMDCGDYEGSLDRALETVDYAGLRVEQQRRRDAGDPVQMGIGVATYVEITGFGGSEYAEVRLRSDGTVLASTGATPIGTGHHTTWAMLVADRLGLPLDAIEVFHGDTEAIPTGNTTGGSRSVQIAGSAMADASEKLVEVAREAAADLLEAAPADVVHDREHGAFHVAGTPSMARTWADVAGAADGELAGLSDHSQDGATFPFGTHVVVVELDTETGQAVIDRVVAVDDSGRIVNPLLAAGQIHGGLAQGIAQGLMEEFRYDENGNPQTTNLADYTAVSTMEVPSYERSFMETPTPRNPLGAKGIGESGSIGSTAAVQSAVVDALAPYGIRHLDMPMTPEKVWAAIDAS